MTSIICAICHENLQPSSNDVSATPCGHVFHSPCLSQWLKTSSSSECPECRHVVNRDQILRLHMNFEDALRIKSNNNSSSLTSKINDLNYKIFTKDSEIRKVNDENIKLKEQNLDICKKFMTAEKKIAENNTSISFLKAQIQLLLDQNKSQLDQFNEKESQLNRRFQDLEKIQLASSEKKESSNVKSGSSEASKNSSKFKTETKTPETPKLFTPEWFESNTDIKALKINSPNEESKTWSDFSFKKFDAAPAFSNMTEKKIVSVASLLLEFKAGTLNFRCSTKDETKPKDPASLGTPKPPPIFTFKGCSDTAKNNHSSKTPDSSIFSFNFKKPLPVAQLQNPEVIQEFKNFVFAPTKTEAKPTAHANASPFFGGKISALNGDMDSNFGLKSTPLVFGPTAKTTAAQSSCPKSTKRPFTFGAPKLSFNNPAASKDKKEIFSWDNSKCGINFSSSRQSETFQNLQKASSLKRSVTLSNGFVFDLNGSFGYDIDRSHKCSKCNRLMMTKIDGSDSDAHVPPSAREIKKAVRRII